MQSRNCLWMFFWEPAKEAHTHSILLSLWTLISDLQFKYSSQQYLGRGWEHYRERNEPGQVVVIDNDPPREQILTNMSVGPRIPD